jgi:ABC-type polysaccharide/polyol phosphate transport system ATPase subunit
MSGDIVDIAVEDVWKQYRLSAKRSAQTFWALQQIALEVTRGASVGVIGRNGAGKSTLLKLLAGITAPTRGRIVIHGRLAALIEVGSGFHPELTGRENIFLSAAILGMRRRDIAARLERIVDFAGVASFVDTPVKWYSSGMYVRLGFAIAAHLEPDILLVDEVLAVGDAQFQIKCLQRIQELKTQGTTSVFISHDLTAVERLCDTAVLLDQGMIAARGTPADVVATYHERLALWDPASGLKTMDAPGGGVTLTNVSLRSAEDPHAIAFATGAPLTIAVRYASLAVERDVEFELRYYAADAQTRVATARTEPLRLRAPGGVVEFTCAALPLKPGSYYIGAVVRDISRMEVIAWWDGETRLYVRSGPPVDGQFYIPHAWQITHAEPHVPASPPNEATPSSSGAAPR